MNKKNTIPWTIFLKNRKLIFQINSRVFHLFSIIIVQYLKLDDRKKQLITDRKRKNAKPELNILEKINADDGLVILKMLAKEDTAFLKRIEHAALEYFKEIIVEDIADEVFYK